MNKSDKRNTNISFMIFIFCLFSTSFDLRSSSREKFLWKTFLGWFGLVGFYGISTIVGYLMPNHLYAYIYIYIYDL